MAKAAPAPAKKKKARADDDEAPVKKKKGTKVAATDDDDDDEEDADDDADSSDDDEEDAEEDSDDEADDDDDEDSSDDDDDEEDSDADDDDDDSDDDDSDSDDDEEPEDDDDDDDDDDSDDDAEEDEDEDEAPTKKKKKSSSGSSAGVSWDPEDAESGGLPEGRIVLLNPRTRLGSLQDYKEDDPDGIPMFSVDAVPSGKGWDEGAQPFEIHLSAGKSSRLVPNDDGTNFVPAEGSKAKGLSKNSNTFFFIKSLSDAGFPQKKFRLKGIVAIHGSVVELVRVPQPKREFAAQAEGASGGDKSMASISKVYSFPWEEKGAKERARAEAIFAKFKKRGKGGKGKSGKQKGTAKVGKKGATKGRPKDESGGGSTQGIAEKTILAVISSPAYKKKGLPLADLYSQAFQRVKQHPRRAEIMKHVKEPLFYNHVNRPFKFSTNRETFTVRK